MPYKDPEKKRIHLRERYKDPEYRAQYRAYQKQYRLLHHEDCKAYARQYRILHKERLNARERELDRLTGKSKRQAIKHKERRARRARQYYRENREYILAREKKRRSDGQCDVRQRQQKANKRIWAIAYLGGKCQRCGRTYHQCCYDFHHVVRSEKTATIANLLLRHVGYEKLKLELSKCHLLCANCHQIVHWSNKGADAA